MENPFIEGQRVLCISEEFPLIREYGGTGIEAVNKPKKNEVLIIDEILGDYLRFNQYDTADSFNWWKYDRFVPIVQNSVSVEFYLNPEIFKLDKVSYLKEILDGLDNDGEAIKEVVVMKGCSIGATTQIIPDMGLIIK